MGTIRKITRKSGTVYSAIVRLAGHPTRTQNFEKQKDAKDWITQTENEIKTKGRANRTSLNKTRLPDIFDAYLLAYPELSDKKRYGLGALSKFLNDLTIQSLTRQVIQKFMDTLLKTPIPKPTNREKVHKNYNGTQERIYKPSTVRRYFYDLKTSVEWWADKENFDLGDRFKRLEIPPAWQKPRDRILGDEELIALLEAVETKYTAKSQWQSIILLGIETGMRPSELLRLQCQNCHLARKHLVVASDTTKTKTERIVPLSNRAITILTATTGERQSGRVFNEIPIGSFSASFKNLCVNAKILNFRFHDLRHTALTRFYNDLGLRDFEVATISGHRQLETLRRYVKHNPEELAEKLNG